MLRQLDITPADVRAADLGVAWNGPLPDILADVIIDAPDGASSLHLAVIGGSHVVTVDSPAGRFREEISCTAPGAQRPLPGDVAQPGYALATTVSCCEPGEFERRAGAIAAGGPDWLIVEFPGTGRHHLTALRGRWSAGQWRWWTHHLYPGENTIVSTRSTYRP